MLFAGASGDPSLTQTGLVPSDAESLRFYIYFGGTTYFSVSLNGQAIRIAALQPLALNSYNLIGGDISQFAGQVATLQITSVYPTTPHLIGGGGGGEVYPIGIDDIQFSSSHVDFGCIPNYSREFKSIQLSNPGSLPAEYYWAFIDTSPEFINEV